MHQYSIGDINDPNKSLILVHNKTDNRWKDVTEEIAHIKDAYYYGNRSGYDIRFLNRQKTYFYKLSSVNIFQNPTIIEAANKSVIADGAVLTGVAKILRFGPLYKIFFSNQKSQIYKSIELKNNATEANVFKYFQELAQIAAQLSNAEDSVETLLYNQYKKIGMINPATALYVYITGKTHKEPKLFNPTNQSLKNELIFPFSFNLSQKDAVIQALGNQVSIIEGPPGCGKTQTILNLLVNLVIRGKTAAVVSNNNTAIRNISDKLEEEKIQFISALLGNRSNKIDFFEKPNKEDLDAFLSTGKGNEDPKRHTYAFDRYKILDFLHTQENLKANRRIELGKIKKEQEHFVVQFSNQITENLLKSIPRLRSKAYLKVKTVLENTRSFGWFQKLRLRFQFGIRTIKINDLENLIVGIDYQYYNAKIEELQSEIAAISQILTENNFDAIKAQYERESKAFLQEFLYERYRNYPKYEFGLESYKREFLKFSQRYPIILSTSHSILTSISAGYLFDYLIVDEASQSDLLSSVLAMSCAKNLVVVGDSQQLDQIDNQEIYDASELLARKYNVEEKYHYKENSLLRSVRKVFADAPVTLLKEHYRCHPKIISFLNEKYYNNQLVVMTKDKDEIPITIVKLVEGNHARKNPNGTGQYNQREIDEVAEYLKTVNASEIGIISPFRVQVEQYKKRFQGDDRIEVDTVHKFQGRQKDAIIISTVVNTLEKNELNERFIDFVNNPKLFNVAVSRAKRFLTLITTHGLYNSKNNNFSDFIKYAEYNLGKSQLLRGKVTSVFDLLYSEYTEELYHFMQHHKNAKAVVSELIAFDLLHKILQQYPGLKVAMHVSIKDLVQNYAKFSQEELKYLKNYLTHVDFVIYNHITKENIIAVEVDGVQYHEQSAQQSLRDSIKNKALAENGLRLVRIKTNESNEELRITSELEKILQI